MRLVFHLPAQPDGQTALASDVRSLPLATGDSGEHQLFGSAIVFLAKSRGRPKGPPVARPSRGDSHLPDAPRSLQLCATFMARCKRRLCASIAAPERSLAGSNLAPNCADSDHPLR